MFDFAPRRDVLKALAGLGACLPLLSPAQLLAQEAPDPYLALIHPDLRDIVPNMLRYMKSMPPLSLATLAERRKPNPLFEPPPTGTVPYERRVITLGNGQPDVTIFVINARSEGARPAILHTHGGGFVTGSARASVRQLQDLCTQLDCVAVSVEYRLAPEVTYKGSIEDNYAGLKWLHDHAAELGVDPARIAVMGESAGGGHAALLALTARDRGEVPVCFQCLIYPMLDDRTGSSRKMSDRVGRLIWTAENNAFGWGAFLGTRPGGSGVPKGAVPARVADLNGLPPTFIGVGTLDLFCDEDIDFARRLEATGVPVELIVVPGAFHGFDVISLMAKKQVGIWFEQTKLNALRRGFGMPAV